MIITKTRIKLIFKEPDSDYLSFVVVKEGGIRKIGCAGVHREGQSHTEIYEYGVDDGFFTGRINPCGGGVFDNCGNYIRPSIRYGRPDQTAMERVSDKIGDYLDC